MWSKTRRKIDMLRILKSKIFNKKSNIDIRFALTTQTDLLQLLLKSNQKKYFLLKKIQMSSLLFLFFSVSCSKKMTVEFLNSPSIQSSGSVMINAADVCLGKVIAGVTGTANCSGGGGGSGSGGTSVSVAEGLYVFASRNDLTTVGDWSDSTFLTNLVNPANPLDFIDRSGSVLTLQSIYDDNDFINLFASKYQVVPNPVTDSDGRFNDNAEGIGKKHYLDRIVGRPDQECGTSGTISQRITHCGQENGVKAFYNGAQYGAGGEGDWRLVTRLSSGEEVWRDERTKLIWSDKAMGDPNALSSDYSHPSHGGYYNWYQASGYAKEATISQNETGYIGDPDDSSTQCHNGNGMVKCQPSSPISVCAEVDPVTHKIIGGGAEALYNYQDNPETAFKGELKASDGVLWKLPSVDDFKIADANGIRKVLRYMDDMDADGNDLNSIPHDNSSWFYFWSSSSYSNDRSGAWVFGGSNGVFNYDDRSGGNDYLVRCVGLSRD